MNVEQSQDIVREFLKTHTVMIVDTCVRARMGLASSLVHLGAVRPQLLLTGTIDEARTELHRFKPRLILCEFRVGNASGLDLIREQREEYGKNASKCLFILVTANASQSAVARSAEEDVDSFVIKPYSVVTLQKCLREALMAKLYPSDYLVKIAEGKDDLAQGAAENARKAFGEARNLEAKPTLACFYLGQTNLGKGALEQAGQDYRDGLIFNKIHYKCLSGLFDLLIKEKNHKEAYDIVKRLIQYYPANAKRLADALRLAIITNNYEDIEGYYRIFTQIDEKSDELVRYVSSALAVTGKHYLAGSTRSRALELFDKVAATCGSRIQFMRYAVEALVDHACYKDAEDFLERFPPTLRGKPDYLMSSLLVLAGNSPSGEVIQVGRSLIKNGIEHPCVYRVLIRHSALAGWKDSAVDLVQTAAAKWPDQKADFDESLAAAVAVREGTAS